MIKRFAQLLQPLATVVFNLLLAYLIYQISRLAFLFENFSYFSENLSFSHLLEMFKGGLLFDTSAILYTNVIWVILTLLPVGPKATPVLQRVLRWLFVIINTLALAVNLTDSVYFKYSMRRTTSTIFNEFSNEHNIGGIVGHELLNHWYFVALTALLAYALFRAYRTPKPLYHELGRKRYVIACLLSMIVFAPFCLVGMRGGWTYHRPINIINANNYCNRPTETALVLNTPFSLLRSIGKNHFEKPDYFQNEQEMAAIFSPIHAHQAPSTDSTAMKKKNVVIIIIESFGREYIGAYNKHLDGGKYKGFTTFTDSLIENGALTYKYSYCNGRKSIDGMPSILSSIPMFVEPLFLSAYSTNSFSGMADCLNKAGYQTAFFHGAARGSMGFLAFARATKFKEYYGLEDYVADAQTNGEKDYDGYWGIADEPFMQYYCHKMSKMKQPFMTAIFTVSSHHPFRVPQPYQDVFKEEHPDMPIYKVVRYTDMALQHFFATARRQPWFNNTIFVITSDHTNMSAYQEYQTDLGGFCSPIIFYDPSGEMGSGMVDAVAQQIDIMPTILEHLGYDKPYFAFGIDLLNTPHDDTWAVNYLNGVYQYVKYGYVLQFDGLKTKAIYSLDDRLMQNNIVGKVPQQAQMEKELKAIIQQYMERVSENRLLAE